MCPSVMAKVTAAFAICSVGDRCRDDPGGRCGHPQPCGDPVTALLPNSEMSESRCTQSCRSMRGGPPPARGLPIVDSRVASTTGPLGSPRTTTPGRAAASCPHATTSETRELALVFGKESTASVAGIDDGRLVVQGSTEVLVGERRSSVGLSPAREPLVRPDARAGP